MPECQRFILGSKCPCPFIHGLRKLMLPKFALRTSANTMLDDGQYHASEGVSAVDDGMTLAKIASASKPRRKTENPNTK